MIKYFGKYETISIQQFYPALIILFGLFLRIFLYPNVPPGLNQDEAASGYEAYSILLTGQDQWGNSFPVHFPGWGAGQSVLYAYLSIPAIKLFGLTRFATRSTSLLFGLLTLPLLYQLVKQTFDRRTALISLLLTAILPWHVMMSRWGLDCNLLPFFLLLGCYLVHATLTQFISKRWIFIALLPWALGLYAYGISLLIVPFLLLLTFLSYRSEILRDRWLWLISIVLFLILASPLFLYVVKDYFVKGDLGIESFLPFSIPLLPSQRFTQVNTGLFDNIFANLKFIVSGFDDGKIWNVFSPFLPLYLIPLPLLFVGIFCLIRTKQMGFRNIFLLWLIACLPLLFAAEINVNRGNAIFLPIIVISAFGFQQIYQAISPLYLRRILTVSLILWVSLSTLLFAGRYFFDYPAIAAADFRAGLQPALTVAVQTAKPSEPILITDRIPLDYVNILYLEQVPPSLFHTDVDVSVDASGLYDVHRFGRFYFDYPSLKPGSDSFVYLLNKEEKPYCQTQSIYVSEFWQVGRCPLASNN